MIDTNPATTVMRDDLLACTRELVRRSCATEAELLLHLAEIDERKLYADRAFPSMHVFCVKELGFSEGAAYNRIGVARAARRWPAVLEALGSGAVHLAGLRVLVPHLTDENHESILAEARGKSKREIEEMAARLSPKPPVPDQMRKLPSRPAATLDKALDALLEKLLKERFAMGTRPRKQSAPAPSAFPSRHIPAEIGRAVYQRAGGRCEFVDENGRRCTETGCLEYDHLDGFARTRIHSVDAVRLVCRGHNAHAAEQLYGRVYMERVRREVMEARAAAPREAAPPSVPVRARPGASPQGSLF